MKMRTANTTIGVGVLAAAALGACVMVPAPAAYAQAPAQNLPPVTLDLRDAPIRSALEQLFNSAKVDFSMDNNVQGFVTLKVTEVPFETALKLIMRSATIPLTYTRENNIYIVRPRAVSGTGAAGPSGLDAPPILPDAGTGSRQGVYPDQINLTYADPADLAQLFGITVLPTFQRQGGMGGGMGGMGGGMGGMGGGMMGGMGGGMMGGMGGGMMGGMGGMGGGMMGGMGGFGGGRGF